jgi:prepilin-type N-terminal cleavage/methylation domain-containing protein
MLSRRRRSFTLLELMIAFVIMAILSAVAIPSLINIASNDRTTADQTSAISVADASYYGAVSADSSGSGDVSVNYCDEADQSTPITFSATGLFSISTSATPEVTEGCYVSSGYTGTVYYQFGDPVIIAVTVAGTDGGALPAAVPSDSTTTSSTSSTTSTTTTTVPYVEPDCSVDVTGPFSAYSVPSTWSVTCTGVTGSEVQVAIPVDESGDFFFVDILSADQTYVGGGGPFTPLPSTFTVDQSYTNPVDDSTPSAPVINDDNLEPSGQYIGGLTIPGTGQAIANPYGFDQCLQSGTGCGTPTYDATGF